MPYTLSQQPVSHDRVPAGSRCEWCAGEAVEQLTVLGGPHHNQSGRFCSSCATSFIGRVRAHGVSLLIFRPATPEQWASVQTDTQKSTSAVHETPEETTTQEPSLWQAMPLPV